MLHAVPIVRVSLALPTPDLDVVGVRVQPVTYRTDPETWPVFTVTSTVTVEPPEVIERNETQLTTILQRLNHRRN